MGSGRVYRRETRVETQSIQRGRSLETAATATGHRSILARVIHAVLQR
jgi:hypothetical protein